MTIKHLKGFIRLMLDEESHLDAELYKGRCQAFRLILEILDD